MFRFDAGYWVLAVAGVGEVASMNSLSSFFDSASVFGMVIGAAWLVESRIGKKIGDSIESHTAVEEARMETVKAEFSGEVGKLGERIEAIHSKLDARPCAISCSHTPTPR